MTFDARNYGSAVAAILHLDGDGHRLMPLATGGAGSEAASTVIRDAGAGLLFPRSRAPEAALAGLYLYFDCWTEAHETAQDVATPEGSYWHAIVHRQEPDAGNAGYWFRQVGAHAIFPALRDAAAEIGLPVGPRWNPEAFIELCERARQSGRAALGQSGRAALGQSGRAALGQSGRAALGQSGRAALGQSPGSELERQARAVQLAEWQLLFDYCAQP